MSFQGKIYNFNSTSPVQINREQYLDVGASAFNMGHVRRGFKGSTDFEIWTAKAGGTQLTETTDYTLGNIDTRASAAAGYNVYTTVTIVNVPYQTGELYFTYKALGSYPSSIFSQPYENLCFNPEGRAILGGAAFTPADTDETLTNWFASISAVGGESTIDVNQELTTIPDNFLSLSAIEIEVTAAGSSALNQYCRLYQSKAVGSFEFLQGAEVQFAFMAQGPIGETFRAVVTDGVDTSYIDIIASGDYEEYILSHTLNAAASELTVYFSVQEGTTFVSAAGSYYFSQVRLYSGAAYKPYIYEDLPLNQYLDTDITMTADSDLITASQKAIKARINNSFGKVGIYRNAIINGNMQVNQRAATYTPNDLAYTVDRWQNVSDGNGVITYTPTDEGSGQHSLKFVVQATPNKKFGIVQHIESKNAKKFQGQYVSLSFEAKTTTAKLIETIRAGIVSFTGTADTMGDIVDGANWGAVNVNPTLAAGYAFENTPANLDLTTDYQTFTIENVLIDTASINNLSVFIWCNDATITAGDELFIKNVQLNEGSVALPFEYLDFGVMLEMCKRHYNKSYDYGTYAGTTTNNGSRSVQMAGVTPACVGLSSEFGLDMFKVPTVTWYAQGGTKDKLSSSVSERTVSSTQYTGTNSAGIPLISVSSSDGERLYGHFVAEAEL